MSYLFPMKIYCQYFKFTLFQQLLKRTIRKSCYLLSPSPPPPPHITCVYICNKSRKIENYSVNINVLVVVSPEITPDPVTFSVCFLIMKSRRRVLPVDRSGIPSHASFQLSFDGGVLFQSLI